VSVVGAALPARLATLACAAFLAGCAAPPVEKISPPAAEDMTLWPSVEILSKLQPLLERHFSLGYLDGHSPHFLKPTAQDIACVTVTRAPLRMDCKYTLVAKDALGPNRPARAVRDLLEKDAAGTWKIIDFDVE
jgi:hypothetical protein